MAQAMSDDAGSTTGSDTGSEQGTGTIGAGLSATGKTADQFEPGDGAPGTTYGGPGGAGTGEQEVAGAEQGQDAAQTSDGDVEGG